MAGESPSSSPRLPSPPPIAEDQISPSSGPNDEHGLFGANISLLNDQAAVRRIRPGSKAEDMHEGPPLVDLSEIDSAFQLTEHLKALHTSYTHPPESPASETAIDRETARLLAVPPPGVDRGIWLYELCRFLTQKANAMVIGLFSDEPACSATTCPEMRASEWQYLCAAHEPPKSCCAIDYCCHTLDWCATSLTSTKLFPSRLSLGTETVSAQIQIRKMTEVFRRVYRIFAHAWFSHRDAFWRVETKTGLYLFFKTVCDEYRLIQEDNYTIPPEAEGAEATPVVPHNLPPLPTLLRRDTVKPKPDDDSSTNTTKRHKHTLSTIPVERSTSVSTIIHEEVEEDDDDIKSSPDHEVEGAGALEILEDEPEQSGAILQQSESTEEESVDQQSLDEPAPMGEYPPTYNESEVPGTHIKESSGEAPKESVEDHEAEDTEISTDSETNESTDKEAKKQVEAETETETEVDSKPDTRLEEASKEATAEEEQPVPASSQETSTEEQSSATPHDITEMEPEATSTEAKPSAEASADTEEQSSTSKTEAVNAEGE